MVKVTAFNYVDSEAFIYLKELPDICPRCHRSIQPKLRGAAMHLDRDKAQVAFLCASKACQELFIGNYRLHSVTTGQRTFQLDSVSPMKHQTISLPACIEELSPSFVEIHGQALAAESEGLDQIVGIGLRKALEFLIKDYCASEHPDKVDKIRSMYLANCITEYVKDANVKVCAERAAWLGNDETHYVRRWENHDVDDLKKLIRLTINWIESSILTKEYQAGMAR